MHRSALEKQKTALEMASEHPLWMKLVQAPGNAEMLKTMRTQISDKIGHFQVCALVRSYIDFLSEESQLAMLNAINDDTRNTKMVCLWPKDVHNIELTRI